MRRVFEQYASAAALMLLTFGLLWGGTRGVAPTNDVDFDDEEEVAWAGWVAPKASSPRGPTKQERVKSTGRRFFGVECFEIFTSQPFSLPFTKSGKDLLNLLRISRK